MTEELVTFPVAKLARKKGFAEICRKGFEWYIFNKKEHGPIALDTPEVPAITSYPPDERYLPANGGLMNVLSNKTMNWPFFRNQDLPPYLYARPTQDLLERWLRERYIYIHLYPYLRKEDHTDIWNSWEYSIKAPRQAIIFGTEIKWTTYEAAREAALFHALNEIP